MNDGCLGPALCPSHALFPESSKGGWRQLVGDDIQIVDSFVTLSVCSKRGVDVFSQHLLPHADIAYRIGSPPSIAAAEKSESTKATSSRMCNGVNLIKFDGNHLGEEGFFGIVYNASALHDIRPVLLEPLGGPARVVGMRKVVCVEDANVVRLSPVWKGEEVVQVLSLGG